MAASQPSTITPNALQLEAMMDTSSTDEQRETQDFMSGSLYLEQGQYEKALPVLEDCLSRRVKMYGVNDQKVAEALDKLAATLLQLGDYDQARTAATRAHHIFHDLKVANTRGGESLR